MKNNTIEKVYQLLQEAGAGGKIFSVTFTKKDGSSRAMNCRTGVKKHLTGGMLKYDPISRGLLPVYDLKKAAYRMINMQTVKRIQYGAKVVNF